MTATPRARAVWTVVLGLGFVVAAIGSAEAAFGWLGVNLSDRNAFYAAVNQHVGQLTLVTMGVGAVAVGFMGRGSRKMVRAMSWVFGVLAVGHLLLFALYFGRIPPILNDPMLAIRTLVWGSLYLGAYGWLAYYLWVQTRVQGWPSRPG